ncbi:GNAT family N-acetyltransferase [Tumebacillus flagellatus]|uniref:N-acetyltransferase domain-containing protein n=1 Tax=Tumebacillus flagellatus TaxID=1157490 RepID=A0A074LGG1_9BACL|nr:GNAT family N-acetyltransferase [Tumebacillus flagellatus]KEO81321.1 hypothetical protein EL26_21450 [Tumebacillus flagellatus]
MTLSWHELLDPQDPLFDGAFALYQASFDEIVREPREVILRGMDLQRNGTIRPNAFHFLIGVDEQNRVAALAVANYLATANFGFLVYLAVHPDFRSHGLGGQVLTQLQRLFETDARSAGHSALGGIVLETEDDEDFARRSRFFQKQGFAEVQGVVYYQPALNPTTDAVALKLFAKGTTDDLSTLVDAMYREKYHLINEIPLETLYELHKQNRV